MGEFEREIEVIPSHESPLRRLVADASGLDYAAYATLAEARQDPDAALIMEGDYGGQIYLACPVSVVAADEAVVEMLLRDVDELGWDGDGSGIRYERLPVGSGVMGGMGGGLVSADIWVHEEYVQLGLDDAIRRVIRGDQPRIPREVMLAAIARRDRLSRDSRGPE